MISQYIQKNTILVRILGIIFILFVAGMLLALLLPNKKNASLEQSSGNQLPLFSDLRLGTPVRAEFATQKNPPIKQKTEYTVKEPIMLQSTTSSSATEPVDVTVRLVSAQSLVSALSPSNITLNPGTSSYCCWNITTPGEYTIQVFHSNSVVTRLPIRIVKDFESTVEVK